MNTIRQKNGLSARRRAIDRLHTILQHLAGAIRRRGLLLPGICLMLASCHEQSKGQDNLALEKKSTTAKTDSLSRPSVNIKVNRHYDEDGNLIGLDSTYSAFYSNVEGDSFTMDSLMRGFDGFFNRNHSTFFEKQFNQLFFNDSLRYPDFFHRDFFLKSYELNDDYLRNMMEQMDSIKNHYYERQSRQHSQSKI